MKGLKGFISQSLLTQAKRSETMLGTFPATKKIWIKKNETIKLFCENLNLKDKLGEYDGNWCEETKTKQMNNTNKEKCATFLMY